MGCVDVQPPPETKPNPTTIDSLGDDLLREVFLRLPSLATLVRAACARRSWRSAISSCPPFRQQFRALHPPPLLGLFFETGSGGVPPFTPCLGLDEDRLTAVRCADFLLTSVHPADDYASAWEILDCRGGYILMLNWDDDSVVLALFNPLSRNLVLIEHPPLDLEESHRGYLAYLDLVLVISDEDPTRFHVIYVCHDESRVAAMVFCSNAWAWSTLPWVEITAEPHGDGMGWLRSGMRAHDSVYWQSSNQEYLVMLDLIKMEFAVIDACLHGKFAIGNDKRGVNCRGRATGFNLSLKKEDSPELEKVIPLEMAVRRTALNLPKDHGGPELLMIRDGLAYMATSGLSLDHQSPACCFLTLCLETMKLEKLFDRTNDGLIHPYVMPWPSFMVGDDVPSWQVNNNTTNLKTVGRSIA